MFMEIIGTVFVIINYQDKLRYVTSQHRENWLRWSRMSALELHRNKTYIHIGTAYYQFHYVLAQHDSVTQE